MEPKAERLVEWRKILSTGGASHLCRTSGARVISRLLNPEVRFAHHWLPYAAAFAAYETRRALLRLKSRGGRFCGLRGEVNLDHMPVRVSARSENIRVWTFRRIQLIGRTRNKKRETRSSELLLYFEFLRRFDLAIFEDTVEHLGALGAA